MSLRRWHSRVYRRRVWIDRELHAAHRRLRQSVPAYVRESNPLSLLAMPVIYSLMLPLVLLDVWATVYQWTCFPIFRVPRVRRGAHFAIDRHKLAYLNRLEKINCMFCSYANGVLAYVGEVAARTEQYWCPIKHARPIAAPHRRYRSFLAYGDASGYRRGLPALRSQLRLRPGRSRGGRRGL